MKDLELGSLAEWIGIVVTAVTIFLTIRHYSNDNKKDFRFMVYQKKKQQKLADGVISTLHTTDIYIHVYNNSKMPIWVRIEGIRAKKGLIRKYYGDIIGKQGLIPLDVFESILTEKVEYLTVEPYALSEPIIIDTNYLRRHLESNGIEPKDEFEIFFREIAGGYNSVSIQSKDKPEHILEIVVNFILKLYQRTKDLIYNLIK